MDRAALACGNLLLGNDEGAAAIELQVFPFEVASKGSAVRAHRRRLRSDARRPPLLPWMAGRADPGGVLRLGPPANSRWRGARAYLCVCGRY